MTETAEPARWWDRRRPLLRHIFRAVSAVVISGLCAAIVGVLTASYGGSLGPHAADYSVRLNGEVRVDMGPLGALIVDSPLPLHLGGIVEVKEIPTELSAPDAGPIAGLTADLESYTQFMANPDAAISDAISGLATDALGRTAVIWTVLLVVIAVSRLAAGGLLRQGVRHVWGQAGVPTLSIGLTTVLVGTQLFEITRPNEDEGRTSAILAETPLAGARITGRLAPLVDHYGGYVVDAVEENSEFYATARENFRTAYAQRTEQEASEQAVQASSSEIPEGTPRSGEERSATEADVSTSGEAETVEEKSITTSLIVSDLHCNVGIAEVINAVIEDAEVELVLNAGDTVLGGTSVESYCVNAFADAIPAGVPVVVSDGNHDSRTTSAQERSRGWIVLEGQPVEVAGLRILGDTDPTLTSLGAPTRPQRDETVNAMGNRLAEQGCALDEAGDRVDVLLIHSPYAGRQIVEVGCANTTISGHLHRELGPRQFAWGTQWVHPSTAGATHGMLSIGPLKNTAGMAVVRWNTETGMPVEFRRITIGTDKSVQVSPWIQYPQLPSEYVKVPVDHVGE